LLWHFYIALRRRTIIVWGRTRRWPSIKQLFLIVYKRRLDHRFFYGRVNKEKPEQGMWKSKNVLFKVRLSASGQISVFYLPIFFFIAIRITLFRHTFVPYQKSLQKKNNNKTPLQKPFRIFSPHSESIKRKTRHVGFY